MVLVFLRHGSNAVLILGVIALAVWAAAGGPALTPGWIVVGALLFYTSGYGWHRFAFHAPPARWLGLRALQGRLHYDHHSEPGRLDLLFLPLWFLAPVLAANAVLTAMLFGRATVAPILFGACLAILHYEWTHYVAHIAYRPKTAWGAFIKRYHLRHHFISEKYWFGVSNPLSDYLFGTAADPRRVEKSRLARNLNAESQEL
jgi:sterol desaturase/sphingolipid hydroxylase (fatty acid hydroxylase superfamily)